MPAKTPTDDRVEHRTRELSGKRHKRYPFANIDNTDTWTSGITGVTNYAWETSSGTQQVLVTESAGVFTFATSAVDAVGFLHVWSAS